MKNTRSSWSKTKGGQHLHKNSCWSAIQFESDRNELYNVEKNLLMVTSIPTVQFVYFCYFLFYLFFFFDVSFSVLLLMLSLSNSHSLLMLLQFNFIWSVCTLYIYIDAGELITVSIRPTVLYGEEDQHFFPTLAKVTKKTGGIIPKILGAGGKHQMTYVGMWSILLCNLLIVLPLSCANATSSNLMSKIYMHLLEFHATLM